MAVAADIAKPRVHENPANLAPQRPAIPLRLRIARPVGRAAEFDGGIERASCSERQNDNMKIRTRDLALLAVGFGIGAVVAVSVTTTLTRPPAAPASSIVATGPALAAASLPLRFIPATNLQWQLPPVHVELPPRFIDIFDPLNPRYPPPRRRVDLIDTRYQPDIRPEDLK